MKKTFAIIAVVGYIALRFFLPNDFVYEGLDSIKQQIAELQNKPEETLPTEEETEPGMRPWIGFVYTYPACRGKRYSEKLIQHACTLAEQDGYENVYVSSNEIGLYEKYGFVFRKMMHTVWGEETQVFEKRVRNERNCCDCNERTGG